MGEKVRGNLVVIGGAEDTTGDCIILREVVRLAGGKDAVIVIITAASSDEESAGDKYNRLFLDLGAREARVLCLATRRQAQKEDEAHSLRDATGVFMTGGDQLRITSILGGTPAYRAIQRKYEEGTVISGTSAGASVMSGAMIVGGVDDEPPKDRSVILAPGLGLLEEVIIDQHFAQRGRIGRLLAVIAQNPFILGLGIDEDTAAVIGPKGIFTVIGSNAVTVVDGSRIDHSNVTETDFGRTLALTNVTMHVLPAGYGFDLKSRQSVIGKGAAPAIRKIKGNE